MNANQPPTPDDHLKQQERSRKRKALLAGGVVLGLGAAITLAAWSDDVFADGVFNTGTIELQGNVTGAGTVGNTTPGWANYDGPDSNPANGTGALAFPFRPQTLVPFEPVYAPIALRLSNDTTIDASDIVLNTVQITAGPAGDPLDTNLDYTVHTGVSAASCNTAGIGASPAALSGVINASPDTSVNYSMMPSALLAPTAPNTQGVLQLCLGVELNSNEDDVKGVSNTTVTWRFTAETD
ncbi:SipW-dependent-type signal peptide-containing protein [Dietzia sp. SYD-A1]|uniref:SipW-dependent-type signal peptide-containing protein n=1 Tax=Dietzia sp. SYD-A1 TaxID=2780141 RepID=UPI00189140D6|nr:SipW-dependent-type signal peptide-containing protein [Dietzia sp. SYD-A1]